MREATLERYRTHIRALLHGLCLADVYDIVSPITNGIMNQISAVQQHPRPRPTIEN
jgi:hypothetical protein